METTVRPERLVKVTYASGNFFEYATGETVGVFYAATMAPVVHPVYVIKAMVAGMARAGVRPIEVTQEPR